MRQLRERRNTVKERDRLHSAPPRARTPPTHIPTHEHEVSGAQCLSRRLILAVFELVFVFCLGGPTPSEAAGGRPLTQR